LRDDVSKAQVATRVFVAKAMRKRLTASFSNMLLSSERKRRKEKAVMLLALVSFLPLPLRNFVTRTFAKSMCTTLGLTQV
jgi:hypothetical protein